jgi:hypothetical protein
VGDAPYAAPEDEVADAGVAEGCDLLGASLRVVEDVDVVRPVLVAVVGPVVLPVLVELMAPDDLALARRGQLLEGAVVPLEGFT